MREPAVKVYAEFTCSSGLRLSNKAKDEFIDYVGEYAQVYIEKLFTIPNNIGDELIHSLSKEFGEVLRSFADEKYDSFGMPRWATGTTIRFFLYTHGLEMRFSGNVAGYIGLTQLHLDHLPEFPLFLLESLNKPRITAYCPSSLLGSRDFAFSRKETGKLLDRMKESLGILLL